jgi:hypothetical protein
MIYSGHTSKNLYPKKMRNNFKLGVLKNLPFILRGCWPYPEPHQVFLGTGSLQFILGRETKKGVPSLMKQRWTIDGIFLPPFLSNEPGTGSQG